MNIYFIDLYVYIITSSPFMFVFGDDRVVCHTGADDILGDVGDA